MDICFHQDPVLVADLCADLNKHGAIYWHSMRPNFRLVFDIVKQQGLEVLPLAANVDGDFLNYIIRLERLGEEGLEVTGRRVSAAIARWLELGEPVPHIERLCDA